MDWIKRNLMFVVGSTVALALLVGAGWYNYTRWQQNASVLEQLNAQYEELKRLNSLNPHPGNEKQDNIKAARTQAEEVNRVTGRVTRYFAPIPAIPEGTNVTSEQYAAALRRTIDTLQKEATNASVVLPPKYGFSFEAQRPLVRFSGSLERLAQQLGEVKALCDILNGAKINSLDGIRRERVTPDDDKGPVTDYLDRVSQTNELAILTPYELTFRCFSPELAAVLTGFGNAPYSLLVKSVNVEPAPTVVAMPGMEGEMPVQPTYVPVPQPTYPRYPQPRTGLGEEAAFAARYGTGPPRPTFTPPPVAPVMVAPRTPTLQTFLDEKQLKVTMLVYVVKLLPKS